MEHLKVYTCLKQ